MKKRDVYYFLGPKTRRIFRRLYFFPIDIYEKITSKRDRMAPPKGKVFIGSGDFIKQGQDILRQLIDLGGVKPNHRVLDIGCGIGRLAIPLTKYLDEKGSYEGFDIVESGITWCKNNIQSKFPKFNFFHVDLRNDLYNLETKSQSTSYAFPYKTDEFDFVFLTSVFTHMMPEDVSSYLTQINKVLKNDGICFSTFFIMNDKSTSLMKMSDGIQFDYDFTNYYLHNIKVKEANVAFKEDYLDHLIISKGFEIIDKHYGYWSGRLKDETVDFQDIYILRKKRNEN